MQLITVAVTGGVRHSILNFLTMSGFEPLGVPPFVCRTLKKMGYVGPTPVQKAVIPIGLQGVDLVAMARTGSGKTAAFLVPIVARLESHSSLVGARAVILAPTRELALQTSQFGELIAGLCDLRLVSIVGGGSMAKQFEMLATNPDIIVATPGRLVHHRVEADLCLKSVLVLVFDEADRLFEMGFAQDIKKIHNSCSNPQRQVMMFSATLPESVQSFAKVGLNDATVVKLDQSKMLSEKLLSHCFLCRSENKIAAAIFVLNEIIRKKDRCLMFVATRHHVDFFTLLCKKLRIKCGGCYGSMDQEAREFQLMRFKQRRVKVMVVTDVAARGLDIDDLEVVLNYDFPTSHRILVHRAGRTARLERAGLCISLITENDLPYAVEQLLHVGRPASMAEITFDKPDKFYTGEEGVTVLGSVGDTGIEQEMVDVAMKFDDISTSYKSVLNSYKLYDRTRPAPSKASIRKARQFTKEAGGFQKMMEVIHPYIRARVLRAAARSTPEDLERKSHYLASIEAYRPNFDDPKLTKQSARVLSTVSTQAMRHRKFSTNLQEYSLKRRDPNRSTICGLSISRSALEGLASKPRRKSEPEWAQPGPVDVGDDPLLDAFSDNDMTDEAGNVVTVSKGAGSLMCSGVTVIADDDNEMRQQRHVMRWNAKNKKYQMVLLDEDGQVVKGRKNEAGQIVKSEVSKKGLYKKWMGQSRLSIQKTGERENKYAANTAQASKCILIPLAHFSQNQVMRSMTSSDPACWARSRSKRCVAGLCRMGRS